MKSKLKISQKSAITLSGQYHSACIILNKGTMVKYSQNTANCFMLGKPDAQNEKPNLF